MENKFEMQPTDKASNFGPMLCNHDEDEIKKRRHQRSLNAMDLML